MNATIEARRNNISIEDSKSADYLSTLLITEDPRSPQTTRDIIVMLLFAGRDNTQNALAWALYALIRNPEWIDKLRIEADMFDRHGRTITYEELAVKTAAS